MKRFVNIHACLVLLFAVCFAMPSFAGQDGDNANEKSQALAEQSQTALLEAGEAEDNEDFSLACSKYSDGADLMERAIYATLPMMLDSDYNSSDVERHNDELQNIVNLAKEGSQRVCGK